MQSCSFLTSLITQLEDDLLLTEYENLRDNVSFIQSTNIDTLQTTNTNAGTRIVNSDDLILTSSGLANFGNAYTSQNQTTGVSSGLVSAAGLLCLNGSVNPAYGNIVNTAKSKICTMSEIICKIDELIQKAQKTGLSIFNKIKDLISSTFNSITGFISLIGKGIDILKNSLALLPDLVSKLVSSITGLVAKASALLDKLKNGISALMNGLTSLTSSLSSLADDLSTAYSGLVSNISSIINTAVGKGKALLDGLKTKASALLDGAVASLKGMVDSALSIGKSILTNLSSAMSSGLSALSSALSNVGNIGSMISSGLSSIGNLLGKAAQNLILDPIMGASGALLNLFSFAGFNFPPDFSKFKKIFDSIPNLTDSVISFLGNNLDMNKFGNMVGLIGNKLGNMPTELSDMIGELYGNSALSNILSGSWNNGLLSSCKNTDMTKPLITSLNNITYLTSLVSNADSSEINKCVVDELKNQYSKLLNEAASYANKLQVDLPKTPPAASICPSSFSRDTDIVKNINAYQPEKLYNLQKAELEAKSDGLLSKYKAKALLEGKRLVS